MLVYCSVNFRHANLGVFTQGYGATKSMNVTAAQREARIGFGKLADRSFEDSACQSLGSRVVSSEQRADVTILNLQVAMKVGANIHYRRFGRHLIDWR